MVSVIEKSYCTRLDDLWVRTSNSCHLVQTRWSSSSIRESYVVFVHWKTGKLKRTKRERIQNLSFETGFPRRTRVSVPSDGDRPVFLGVFVCMKQSCKRGRRIEHIILGCRDKCRRGHVYQSPNRSHPETASPGGGRFQVYTGSPHFVYRNRFSVFPF